MKNYRKKFGYNNEELCAEYLINKGYKILKRNLYSPQGEVDIIALSPDKTCLCFIEVKSRFKNTFDTFPAVGIKQIDFLSRFADYYRSKFYPHLQCRLDLVTIYHNDYRKNFQHYENITSL